ncbi:MULTISPECIES: hypothetical protein [Cytobacillus]|uniref:Uncharacterized protein n=1 Tax=Cytobacillus stercorigallinarum TaxID=2762240 RepID=A0ABR8QPX3_9BACI|nr:hypothetical protein [Cytobacillus stercorigallinarum]MBD7937482.1 hypothetical protein [Cytobacillus stercorigallinarum]
MGQYKGQKMLIPLLLLLVNIVLISLIIQEFLNGKVYGILGLLTPILAIISFFYIRNKNSMSPLIIFLQGLNGFFVLFPIFVLLVSFV